VRLRRWGRGGIEGVRECDAKTGDGNRRVYTIVLARR
jgi:hypothetical protein